MFLGHIRGFGSVDLIWNWLHLILSGIFKVSRFWYIFILLSINSLIFELREFLSYIVMRHAQRIDWRWKKLVRVESFTYLTDICMVPSSSVSTAVISSKFNIQSLFLLQIFLFMQTIYQLFVPIEKYFYNV